MKTIFSAAALCLFPFFASAEDKTPAAKDPELRKELLERTKEDQDARNAWVKWVAANGQNGRVESAKLSKEKQAELEALMRRLRDADAGNTKWLKEIVGKHGWPTIAMAGKDGANAAWLLVQHADADIKFQRQCLDLMTKLPKDQVSQGNLAYLTDRVLLAEGKKQLYGTQFQNVDGKWQPRPLEDEANVDKRRAEAGLQPIAEYKKIIEQQYSGKPKK